MQHTEIPTRENQEEKEKNEQEIFEHGVEKINNQLLDELRERFPESDFEYHNLGHSFGVGERASNFLKSVSSEGVTDRQRALARTLGYGHDIIQTCKEEWPEAFSGIGTRRQRITGDIELESAEHVLELFARQGLVLDEEGRSFAKEVILVTVPGFDFELKTVIQPNLRAESSTTAWAIAAADLGTSGYDPEQFMKDGDAVFCEDRRLPQPETLDEETLNKLYQELIAWTANQVSYAQGQKQYWNREIVPSFIKEQLVSFDESIELAQVRLARRQSLFDAGKPIVENVQVLLDDMGFTRFEK